MSLQRIVYLSEAQLQTLFANGSVTSGQTTITYSDDDLYVTPEDTATFVETVSGTTPVIIGEPNIRYVCGEVTEITITPPATGTISVRFTSGTTPAVLTLPNTVIFPDGVSLTTLLASTIYEIMITDGIYGGVMTWQG